MHNYIIFNDISSKDFNLITTIKDYNLAPQMRSKTEYVINRNGGYTFKDGYENKTIEVEFTLLDRNPIERKKTLSNIMKWLSSTGKLTLGYESEFYYDATMRSSVESSAKSYIDTFTVIFDCKPFKYQLYENTRKKAITTNCSFDIYNDGNLTCKPNLIIEGTCDSIAISTLTLTNITSTLYIDSENYLIYSLSGSTKVNQLSKMTGSFFDLETGKNTINVTVTNPTNLYLEIKHRNIYL